MKTNPYLLAVAIGGTGLLTGYTAKRLAGGPSGTGSEAQASLTLENRTRNESPTDFSTDPKGSPGAAKPGDLPHSTDTLESIIALGEKGIYGRLALWLMDASEQDIASYWQHYRQQKDHNNDTADLIFINWTRLNPQGAIAAAAGTPNEQHAWWAWACHDPTTALATAISSGSKCVTNVAWGIGEFHGDWLREHFDEIPESARSMAIGGLIKWDDGPDPLETLKFLKENNAGFSPSIFSSLIRKDPWAAFDWIQQSGGREFSQFGGSYDTMSNFVKTMGEVHPEMLERLAQQTPSGALKREMEAAVFENLLKSDPDAAIEQAKAIKAPKVAVERLSAAGLSLVASDPDRAFEMAKSMIEISPTALVGQTNIVYPNGSSTSWSGNNEANQFMSALLSKDPDRVMEMVPPGPANHGPSSFDKVAGAWAQLNLVAYTTWVNHQSDPAVREPAAKTVVNQLQSDGQYFEAADWAMSLTQSRGDSLRNVLSTWQRTSPDEARTWLESADLTEQERQSLEQVIKTP